MQFFEDLRIGDKSVLGSYTFSAEAVMAFGREFDPQAFHTDAEAAKQSSFGALCASGWHTTAAWMRCFVDCRAREDAQRAAQGEPSATLGPSPGFRNLKWTRPVYAGDTITFAQQIVDLRALASRPRWGLVTALNSAENQRQQPVLSFTGMIFVERRPG
ncbi:MAG: MaoC family dehydratase [Proteobacteria bacterium]|nr:MaoC family dehydratase [Pseudomonadota bacterium]